MLSLPATLRTINTFAAIVGLSVRGSAVKPKLMVDGLNRIVYLLNFTEFRIALQYLG